MHGSGTAEPSGSASSLRSNSAVSARACWPAEVAIFRAASTERGGKKGERGRCPAWALKGALHALPAAETLTIDTDPFLPPRYPIPPQHRTSTLFTANDPGKQCAASIGDYGRTT
ncbi:hypothetical protein HPB50_026374 [Hyalomma asiaticum]|uniref:Uncharacterized protein n=1 Tax=Hyalomma asiaticum TaxID=266040 RepID=A0ACB7TAT4_HYAAI|nr:hypothetical protein HPB50_026374 [Hyalomma asiaticum]